MDSFELNKILGALLATCLGVLSLNIAAGAVFTPSKMEKPGYAIVVPDQSRLAAKPPSPSPRSRSRCGWQAPTRRRVRPPPSNARPATPSKRAARTGSARTCTASSTAPRLRSPGFNYSAALKAKGGTWTFDDLDHFLANPKAWLPGTNMGYAGLARGGQRADLINYLHTLSDSPVPLPKAAEAAPPGPAAEKK